MGWTYPWIVTVVNQLEQSGVPLKLVLPGPVPVWIYPGDDVDINVAAGSEIPALYPLTDDEYQRFMDIFDINLPY